MKLWTKYFLLGAVSFWVPGVILTVILHDVDPLGLGLFTILPTISLLSIYWFSTRQQKVASAPSVAAHMLLGIYVLGAWFVMLGDTFAGGGLHAFTQHDLWFLALCFLPPMAWLLAGPQVFSLLFVTLFLIFAHFRWERGRWVFLYSWHKKTKLNAPLS